MHNQKLSTTFDRLINETIISSFSRSVSCFIPSSSDPLLPQISMSIIIRITFTSCSDNDHRYINYIRNDIAIISAAIDRSVCHLLLFFSSEAQEDDDEEDEQGSLSYFMSFPRTVTGKLLIISQQSGGLLSNKGICLPNHNILYSSELRQSSPFSSALLCGAALLAAMATQLSINSFPGNGRPSHISLVIHIGRRSKYCLSLCLIESAVHLVTPFSSS